MEIRRRTFLAAGTLFGFLGLDLRASTARAQAVIVRRGRLTTTICPYCAVGCGVLVASVEGKVARVEGDPDHPVNRGSLCAKGSAIAQVVDNPKRLTSIKYRAPGASKWEEKDWNWVVRWIAERIRQTRDAAFTTTDAQGRTVNRTRSIGCLGGAALTNEECYTFGKLARALGVVYLEHQARVCHSATVSGLTASFGRGAMTNHFNDVARADCILIIGANPAENHPVAMKWVTAAQDRGAHVISVDPRFTRTSAVADVYVPLRSGTDVAFVGGLIRHALEHGRIHRDYLLSAQQSSPTARVWRSEELGKPDEYPIVATTCRVSEHWAGGAMSRNLPWLVELVPDGFCEISRELARAKGIACGDRVVIRSARGKIVAYALVTGRLKALEVDGRKVEQVAVVWHFGYAGLATGDSANLLTASVGDREAMIPEYKAFLCDVELKSED